MERDCWTDSVICWTFISCCEYLENLENGSDGLALDSEENGLYPFIDPLGFWTEQELHER